MIEKVEGIILTELDYGETSKILNVLTKEYGIIGLISKGCRSVKSPLCSLSQTFVYGYFYIYYKKDKLSIVKTIDLINCYPNIRKDILKISYASLILDLAMQVYRESKQSEIFFDVVNSFEKIEQNFDPSVITLILELRFLEYLGVAPVIDCCAVCQTTKDIKTLSLKRGGYVCKNCYDGEKIYQPKTIKMIRMFYYVDIKKITKISIQDEVKKEIRNFLDLYYDDYTGLYLKSKQFLNKIEKIVVTNINK